MLDLGKNAAQFALFLGRELKLGRQETDVIRYGTEIFLSSVIKLTVIILISYFLHITPYVLVALATSTFLRILSGGVHCHSYARCLFLGVAMTVIIGSLAAAIGAYVPKDLLLILALLSALSGLYIVYKWAPSDNTNKPITCPEKRNKFRKLSLFYVFIWVVLIILFIVFGPSSIIPLVLASIGGFHTQVFSLCPTGYRLVGKFDYLLSKILP